MAEETLEGSRISLENEDGTKLVTIYPKVSGSISTIWQVCNKIRNCKTAGGYRWRYKE